MEDIRLTGTSFVHETAQASPILSAPHTFCWLIALPVRSSVPDTYHNSLAPGQLKGIMQAPLVMACHFPIPVITGVCFPSCHLYLSPSEHRWQVRAWSLHSRNGSYTLLWCKHLVCKGKFSDLPGCTKRLWCGHWPHSPTTEDISARTRPWRDWFLGPQSAELHSTT